MLESFGARLRRRREEQGIALATIAEQTRIKLSLLEALERDDVSHWPAGIFRRAFIRAYAHAIGLNPDVVVREFLEVYPEPIELDATGSPIAPGVDATLISGGPPTRLRYLVDSAIGSLSRLRRSPAAEEALGAEFAGGGVKRPSGPEGQAAAPQSSAAAPGGAPASESERFDSVNQPAGGRNYLKADTGEMVQADTAAPAGAETIEGAKAPAASPTPAKEPAPFAPDFLAVAHLCTELGRVENPNDLQQLLQEAAKILDAMGLIVWVWDEMAAELRPALAQGYSDEVLAQVPGVTRDADNATAAAFRTAQTCAMTGSEHTSGALVVPLLTPAGCAGVLAIELQHGNEQSRSVRAVATIFAAQLAQLIGGVKVVEGRPPSEATGAPAGDGAAQTLRSGAGH